MAILRCIARRPAASAFRAAASAASTRQAPSFARSLYTVPSLDRHDLLVENGVPGLFSQRGFSVAFTKYQQHIVDELNASTVGTPLEGQDIKSLVIELARDPTKAYVFNLASMAFNNHFFFRGINTNPDVQSAPSSDLAVQIKKDFNSIDTLRETFIATAESMFGPGFVWLVQTNDVTFGGLRILPTYIAGSPLSGAHYRRQSHDLNTHNADSYQKLNSVGTFGSAAMQPARPRKPLGGTDVVPLLCVNTWEHAWLHDYGVKGKSAYLRAWWEKIDWDLVRQNVTINPDKGRQNQFAYS
ncbi:Fe superoxide dismutase-like protein [Macroventuria anomochaeta]|uniref:Fe superoxide dismutase-like protein n=1 Tax=Macroventuria anomochaeta TaxID=301207 RepID=A0ACB6S9D1_9PLEO|nr:Fe superoxide dismutase-like protein [Macroventuria anomochaeta]KAF2630875.1 Fe superoxide dismutase-like protein [Macroventuria anomochaeta]